MTEIKPCPFCGTEGEVIDRHNPISKWRWSVDCSSTTCGASGPIEATPAEAIAAWNQRVPGPSLLNGLREAREALWSILSDEDVALSRPDYEAAHTALAHLDTLLAQEGEGC